MKLLQFSTGWQGRCLRVEWSTDVPVVIMRMTIHSRGRCWLRQKRPSLPICDTTEIENGYAILEDRISKSMWRPCTRTMPKNVVLVYGYNSEHSYNRRALESRCTRLARVLDIEIYIIRDNIYIYIYIYMNYIYIYIYIFVCVLHLTTNCTTFDYKINCTVSCLFVGAMFMG